ncbi:MAG: hypothetical protein IJR58_07915 [Lachnospiraceae bacterium]|nr:hypothetical protein [Lachnospiraceae bacterium]
MEFLFRQGRYYLERLRAKFSQDDGMGTVEVILIIVVLIGLVIVFKEQISGLVEDVFKTITDKKNVVTG